MLIPTIYYPAGCIHVELLNENGVRKRGLQKESDKNSATNTRSGFAL